MVQFSVLSAFLGPTKSEKWTSLEKKGFGFVEKKVEIGICCEPKKPKTFAQGRAIRIKTEPIKHFLSIATLHAP